MGLSDAMHGARVFRKPTSVINFDFLVADHVPYTQATTTAQEMRLSSQLCEFLCIDRYASEDNTENAESRYCCSVYYFIKYTVVSTK